MEASINDIMLELKGIKYELDFIKENMPEKDSFLSFNEIKLLKESYFNEKEEKLISANQLKKELGI